VLHALGRAIARHARWFAALWLVLVVAGFGAATGALGGEGLFARLAAGDAPQVPGESADGRTLLTRSAPDGPVLELLVDGVDPRAATLRDVVTQGRTELSAVDGVASVADPYLGPHGAPSPLVATDGRAFLVAVTLDARLPEATEQVATRTVVNRLSVLAAAVRSLEPGARTTVGGVQPLVDEINSKVAEDLRRGETIALPLSLLVLVVVFGGLLAAGLPVLGALASIAGALATLLGFSYVMELEASVPSVVSVLGLGLCIDYGLLLVSRYREELRRLHGRGATGPPSRAALEGALERTMGTAGRTVLFSAVTVAVSLTGLLFMNATILRAVGAAGVSVVVVALLVALTLVPALMALAGDRLVRPGVTHRVPLLARLARRLGDVAPAEGAFSRLARRVQRRPLLVIVAVVTVLGLAAVPVLSIRLVSSGVQLLPTSSAQRQLFEALDTRFPATTPAPIRVVAPGRPAADLDAWARTSVATLPGVASVDPATVQGSGADQVAVVGIRTAAGAQSDEARDVVRRIRDARPAFEILVTGESANVTDFTAGIARRAPYAVGLVVLATFALLFLMTGSVLVPLKALVMNVVSLGASFGVLVWVFQQGHLESLLGFSSAGGIDLAIPALTLAFAFGLSMDYEVFLLSRIKEFRDLGLDNDAAVLHGLQRSGRIITSAALVVVIVFAGFVAGELLIIKQMGVALAVAVAVDATLVRMLLVPATMTLLGEWNWWAPGPLRRLHDRFGLRESAADLAVDVETLPAGV
jgi:RND superfamily putative drug exporter